MDHRSHDAFRRADAIFDAALDLAAADRAGFVAEACSGDPSLRDTVERLLRAHDRADDFLAEPLVRPRPLVPNAEPPARLGPYRVIRELGHGGMGVVYLAESADAPDISMPPRFALKVMRGGTLLTDSLLKRFLAERRILASLDHPNIARLLDAGVTDDGDPYLAMEYCERGSLADRLKAHGALPIADALAVARQLAAALGVAHAGGIVHRDVKPGNVLFDADDRVRLSDFGIAKLLEHDSTKSGVVLGTAAYLSPEQVRSEPIDHRADLWALGVVLYEMLAGRRPFVGEHDAAVAYAIVHEAPPPLATVRPEVPNAVDAVVRSLLEKDRAKRPPSADAVLAAIDAAAAGHAPRPRRSRGGVTIVLIAGAFVVATVVSAPIIRRRTRPTPPPDTTALVMYRRGREFERRQPPTRETLDLANVMYLRALAADSTFAAAHARLGNVAVTALRTKIDQSESTHVRARLEIETALRARPTPGDAYFALGRLLAHEQRTDSALVAYRLAEAAMPDDAELQTTYGRALQGQGRWEEALVHFERAARLDPFNPNPLQEVAIAQSRLRRYQAAIASWNRAVRLGPEDPQARLIRGYVYLRLNGRTDSLASAIRSLPADWDPRGSATWARFNVARIGRRPADALAAVQAMRSDSASDGFYFRPRSLLLAQAYADLGKPALARAQYERARALLERHLAAQPRDARAHAALGLAYAGLGRRDRAVAAADSAVEIYRQATLTPNLTAAMGEAAEVHVRVGDIDGTIALLEQLLSMPAGREISVPLLRADPLWDPVRRDPRFEPMLRRFAPRNGLAFVPLNR